MNETTNTGLFKIFGLLSNSAARKKIYSHMAVKKGNEKIAYLLRALMQSEAVQAKRIYHNMRGKIDKSDSYLATIFEKETQANIDAYSEKIREAELAGMTSVVHALSQLRAAEKIVLSFYKRQSRDVSIDKVTKYFVCKFCGYVCRNSAPDKCPICTAAKEHFKEVL